MAGGWRVWLDGDGVDALSPNRKYFTRSRNASVRKNLFNLALPSHSQISSSPTTHTLSLSPCLPLHRSPCLRLRLAEGVPPAPLDQPVQPVPSNKRPPAVPPRPEMTVSPPHAHQGVSEEKAPRLHRLRCFSSPLQLVEIILAQTLRISGWTKAIELLAQTRQ